MIGHTLDINDIDLMVSLMSHENLVYTYSEINKHLLDVHKPE